MRPSGRVLLWGLFSLLLPSCATLKSAPEPRETTVWVVRHAEKATDDPKDPSLSEAGLARAEALAERLEGEGIAALFATHYRRSKSTAAPLAARLGKDTLGYEPQDFAGLSARIRGELQGKKLLVVGHSNTVLELIEALGASRPVPALSDADYDFLFKVTIPEQGRASVETMRMSGGPAPGDAAR